MRFNFTCPACDEELEVEAYHTPAKNMSGRFEDAEPEESGCEPSECPHCDHEIYQEIMEHLGDAQDAAEEDYWEAKAEMMREREEDY